jgi:1-aminocyclopropane-1-carboxylate deaminase/D-cysteine desulfhydrase-like pyridoxal-dependent ACC family enzyme
MKDDLAGGRLPSARFGAFGSGAGRDGDHNRHARQSVCSQPGGENTMLADPKPQAVMTRAPETVGIGAASFPRIPLANLPTPLEDAPRLSAELDGPRILLKREDLTGLGLGGNKARELELILGEALAQGADAVIATAGIQSNYCRMLAAAAARLGLRAELLLLGTPPARPQGNLLLDRLYGATVHFFEAPTPYAPEVSERMRELEQALRERGYHPAPLDLWGTSGTLASAAYVIAARELAAQLAGRGLCADRVVGAVGAGNTMVGLALGLQMLRNPARTLAMCVFDTAERMRPHMMEVASHLGERVGAPLRLDEAALELHDHCLGSGYGAMTPEGLEAMRLLARTEGVVLDPVYTGKAMAGLISLIRSGRIGRGEIVVFVHTGGVPALFAFADQVDFA